MIAEGSNPSEEDQMLARHRAFAEVLENKRPMAWSDWTMIIHESKCLTPEGKRMAFWATDILQQTLKDNFLQKVRDWLAKMQAQGDPDLAPRSHPIFSLALWPTNDVPWVYANLIRLAAQIRLLLSDEKNRHKRVLKKLNEDPNPIRWLSTLVQFEVAALGLMAGWEILLEPDIGKKGQADVRLTSGSTVLFAEVTTMRPYDAERKAVALYERLSWQLYLLGSHYDVRISGKVSQASLSQDDIRARWFWEVEEAAQATAKDGRDRQVPGPGGVLVTVFRPTEATMGEPWGVEGDPVEARILERLLDVLDDKNDQAKGSLNPVWVRVDEFAGVWECTRGQGWTLAQTLAYFTNFLRQTFPAFPNLAGVILSPGLIPAFNAPLGSLVERIEYHGAIALQGPIPVNYYREMLIIPRAGLPETEAKVFENLYRNEPTWLDWVLKHLGHPPFDSFMRE